MHIKNTVWLMLLISALPITAAHSYKNHAKITQENAVIVPYNTARDEAAIKKIALANIYRLSSTLGGCSLQQQKLLVEKDIMPHFTDSTIISNVCLIKEQPIGFINYSIASPWHGYYGPNAKIYHIAVDEHHQNNGYGSLLLSNALANCSHHNVNHVSLWTTGPGSFSDPLHRYYTNHGFKLIRRTKFHEQLYRLRLKPNPLTTLTHKILNLVGRR